MAIEKEKFFEIIKNVSKSKDLSEDNLLGRIKNELKEKDIVEYNKFDKEFSKEYQFGIKISEEAAENWTLLHLAVACDNLSIVELLLEKKVNVNTRVKDGSKDDGPTALHIAAFYGHKDMVEQLLKDDRVNPSLKSKNKTPKDMVGDVSNKNTIVEMLETAEKNYSPKKAKDLNIKIEGGGHYHLSQNNHKTQASLAVNVGNVTSAPANVIDPHLERCDSMHSDGSISDDSGLESEQTIPNTSFHFEMNPNGANHVEENVDNKTLESTLRSQIQLKDSRIQELEKSDKELKRVEEKLEEAQKDLETLKDHLAKNETKQEALNKLDEENKSLKQEIEDLKSENATLNSELEETKNQHSQTSEVLLKKAQEELAELTNCVAGHETRLEALNKLDEENKSLKQEIEDLKSENATLNSELEETKNQHSQTSEVSLKKVEKKPPLSKIAYVSLVATSVVGSILSVVSGLFVLSMIATSVTSALVAGGITYTMSKPITELKEVNIQSPDNNKACKI